MGKNILFITPWDKKNLKVIEKAILDSSLSLFPNNNGKCISINVPPLTKQDRENTFKELKKKGEELKISIRQIRRNHNNLVKSHIKKYKLSSDIDNMYLGIIQKQTDDGIKYVE